MLAQQIEGEQTPAMKEARRQLRIETETLLAEIGTSLRIPSYTNRSAVEHRLKAWTGLLQQLRDQVRSLGNARHDEGVDGDRPSVARSSTPPKKAATDQGVPFVPCHRSAP
jgi:hypothetical protein